jgi:serine/threonine protein kinase/Tfp pilus assembly protein PilF
MPVLAGTRLGPYEIIDHLGSGGMGEVYRAHDTRLGREVAIKVLAEQFATDPGLTHRFDNEARAIASLSHPNICALYDVGSQGNTHFLVMEFLRGQTLAVRLCEGALPLPHTLQLATQIADALDKAHRLGIVHRDLKPGNVMLTENGAKLLDFGLAKSVTAGSSALSESATDVTSPGTVLGTISYMSPDQLRGLPLDARTDLWSFGVMLYEMVTGRHPFSGPTASDQISQILTQQPLSLAHCGIHAPEALEGIISKALAKDREERYQTARDLLLDLKRLRAGLETPTGAIDAIHSSAFAHSQAAPAVPFRNRPGVKWLLAGLLAVILAVAALLVGSRFFKHAEPQSIAVMPLTYNNSDPKAVNDPEHAYLADGLTESFIEAISAVSDVKVISRTSVFRYKGSDVDPGQIGRELGVSKILYGKLFQRGDDISVDLELVDAPTRQRVWGNRYNAKILTLVSLPKEVALQLANGVHFPLRKRSFRFYTASPTAYQEYLRGRHYWNERTEDGIKKAIEYFQRAIAADPQYALAYSGLADAYHVLWVYSGASPRESYLQAKPAALKALELDPDLPEAHTSIAAIKADDEWDFAGAEREFRQAIDLDPNYATAHQWYAECLSYRGRLDEAISELHLGIRLDPLSPIIHATLGDALYRARRFDEAVQEFKTTLDIDSGFPLAHSLLRNLYEARGDFAAAISESKAANIAWGASPEEAEAAGEKLRRAYTDTREHGYWLTQLELTQQRAKGGHVRRPDDSAVRIAAIYTHLGEREQAFHWLATAFDERDANVLYIKTGPEFDSLRSDPRAVEMIKRLGL